MAPLLDLRDTLAHSMHGSKPTDQWNWRTEGPHKLRFSKPAVTALSTCAKLLLKMHPAGCEFSQRLHSREASFLFRISHCLRCECHAKPFTSCADLSSSVTSDPQNVFSRPSHLWQRLPNDCPPALAVKLPLQPEWQFIILLSLHIGVDVFAYTITHCHYSICDIKAFAANNNFSTLSPGARAKVHGKEGLPKLFQYERTVPLTSKRLPCASVAERDETFKSVLWTRKNHEKSRNSHENDAWRPSLLSSHGKWLWAHTAQALVTAAISVTTVTDDRTIRKCFT